MELKILSENCVRAAAAGAVDVRRRAAASPPPNWRRAWETCVPYVLLGSVLLLAAAEEPGVPRAQQQAYLVSPVVELRRRDRWQTLKSGISKKR